MTDSERLQSINDLASARLRNGPLDPNVEHDLKMIVRLSERGTWQQQHYPEGMGEESRRLHREYNAAVANHESAPSASLLREILRVTDECAAKGVVLVPNGENL